MRVKTLQIATNPTKTNLTSNTFRLLKLIAQEIFFISGSYKQFYLINPYIFILETIQFDILIYN
jgi:hypothetical protein